MIRNEATPLHFYRSSYGASWFNDVKKIKITPGSFVSPNQFTDCLVTNFNAVMGP
jgi:hypothetical protein